jgi:hypothetical protein
MILHTKVLYSRDKGKFIAFRKESARMEDAHYTYNERLFATCQINKCAC